MKTKERAIEILNNIEGTLIADLETIRTIATRRNENNQDYKELKGGLNYTLFLMALVTAEVLGLFLNKNSTEGDTKGNISFFINSKF